MNDRALAEKAASGCEASLTALIEGYYDRIHHLAWRFSGSQAMAEDIAQDVCVKVAASIRSFRFDAEFSTWVWRVTYAATVDRLRASRRLRAVEPRLMAALVDVSTAPRPVTPEDALIGAELWAAVRELPPQQRDAVFVVYGEDMSHAEAASVVAIVTFASDVQVALKPTKAANKGEILAALNALSANGGTAGSSGLVLAYGLAEQNFSPEAANRIILATDGDFNEGVTDHERLKQYVAEKRRTGVFLSIIGVGHDNHNDALMQAVAQNGNGQAVFVDNLNEARKVLDEQSSSMLLTIAKDARIQVEFNPSQVSEYRLIGYETRALHRRDFNNDKVDAGEVGSGHSVTAIYEVTPMGAPKFEDDLRYGKAETTPAAKAPDATELGFLKLPTDETSKLITLPITPAMERPLAEVSNDIRFSVAVAAFGQLLTDLPYLKDFSYDDVIALAQTARGRDLQGHRAEFVNLVRLAKTAQPRP